MVRVPVCIFKFMYDHALNITCDISKKRCYCDLYNITVFHNDSDN